MIILLIMQKQAPAMLLLLIQLCSTSFCFLILSFMSPKMDTVLVRSIHLVYHRPTLAVASLDHYPPPQDSCEGVCSVCLPCLTRSEKAVLTQALHEHLNRQLTRRILPPQTVRWSDLT